MKSALTIREIRILVEEVRFNLSSLIERTGSSLLVARLPSLRVEPNLFRQLLQNLVENSIRHRSTRLPSIVVRHDEECGFDVISIEDNGTGIPAAELERAFGQFEQGGASQANGGTGLGLALCRRVVSLHDGSIEIDPAYEGGCRMVLRIPRHAPVDSVTRAA